MTMTKALALFLFVFTLPGLSKAQTSQPDSKPAEALWFEKPLRAVQTLLRESDAKDYKAEDVVEYLKSVNANCIVMNAGGVIDFFRHDHEMANPSSFLEDRDILGDLVKACHRKGIRVLVRVDFRGAEEERYQKHTDWFAVKSDGSPKITSGDIHQSCFNGKYRNEYGAYFIRYLLETYDVDGIWYNAIQSDGACYCEPCQTKYKQATGEEIPRFDDTEEDFLRPEMAEYRTLKDRWALDHVGKIRDLIKSHGEDKVLLAEIFGMYGSRTAVFGGIDLYTISPYFDFLIGKAFPGDGQTVAYPASTIRFLKSLAPEKQTILLASVNRNENRMISENPIDVRCWFWETIAAGGGIWNSTVAGQHPDVFLDRRNAHLERDAFEYLQKNADLLGSQVPVADVKLYYSGTTRRLFHEEFAPPIQGVERVLLDKHIPYSFFPDLYSSAESLKNVKLLILPNVMALSDEQMNLIREYVKSGGHVIADSQTSLFDEKGQARKDFGLSDLFGCSYTGKEKDTARGSYLHIKNRHEILRDCAETEILLNGGVTLICSATTAQPICTLIPTVRSQPPEHSWIKNMQSDDVVMAINSYGKGKVVYFANNIMRLCLEDGHKDFNGVLGGAIDYCLGANKTLETDAPPSVLISLLANEAGQFTLSLVNHSASPYRPSTTLTPVRDIHVTIKINADTARTYKVLKADSPVQVDFSQDGTARIHIDEIQEFTAVGLGI